MTDPWGTKTRMLTAEQQDNLNLRRLFVFIKDRERNRLWSQYRLNRWWKLLYRWVMRKPVRITLPMVSHQRMFEVVAAKHHDFIRTSIIQIRAELGVEY